MKSIVSVQGLRVIRQDRTICAVDSFQLQHGSNCAVYGSNGCGKSTFLKVLAGLESVDAGTVQQTAHCTTLVHQSPYLFDGSVATNVAYGLKAQRKRSDEIKNAVAHWLNKFQLEQHGHQDVRSLSGGEKRRVALARACAVEPDLLLLDEPLAELDSPGIERVAAVLNELKATSVIIASPVPLPLGLVDQSIRMDGCSDDSE